MRVLPALFLTFAACLPPAHADDAAASVQALALLQLAGTAAVFDSPAVQQALARPEQLEGPDAGARRLQLLAAAGLRPWHPPRVWLLRAHRGPGPGQWESLAAELSAAASLRGYALVDQVPLPAADAAIGLLAPEHPNPGLGGLLDAYGADVLVLLRDRQWTLWAPGMVRQGVLTGAGVDLLPGVLAEVMAAHQQWPEARGLSVVAVDAVARLADFAAVQTALQALPGVAGLRLVRVERGRVWFVLAAPELPAELDADPRLPAQPAGDSRLGAPVALARQLGCPLLVRRWKPPAADPVQSPQ